MKIRRGDEIDVGNGEQGYLGSYYEAIVSKEINKTMYIVEYKNLIKDDESGPLKEMLTINEIRPKLLVVPFPIKDLSPGDKIDAFDNDGWWSGTITKKIGSEYVMHFPTTGETIPSSSIEKLRFHLDWVEEKWVSSKFGSLALQMKTGKPRIRLYVAALVGYGKRFG
ncbi:DUF724 domain-containing protein 2-like, partial [Carica papaya]|uniref:DUF724 domain-containing protein 2-like n=1 Tax=Carica papaya TaxID=3649 RepID=UPI000B8CF0DB